jgi:L,D-peptidoglycan transpeptidase YkuD (ErfK/YbiS/YcfS/YnhG family)
MATPAGIWRLDLGGFRPDRLLPPSSQIPLLPILPTDIWSDDPADPAYNRWLTRRNHAFSHERLRRAGPYYDLVLMSDWNRTPPLPGRGSAIFVHAWRKPRHPTAGCLAFRPGHLAWITAHWTPRSRVVVLG